MERTYWWFVGKRYLARTILKTVVPMDGPKDKALLDIGCGTGMVMELLGNFGNAFGMDVSSEALRFLRKSDRHRLVKANADNAVPFKDDTFSTITCLDVLEHLDDDLSALKEAYRVCAPGGHMILTVPAFHFLWSPHDEALHHRRRYTRSSLLHAVSRCKWQVAGCSYYNLALFLPILAVRMLSRYRRQGVNPRSDFSLAFPRWLNAMLAGLFCAEIRLLRFLYFPFGVSLVAILRKPAVS